MVVDYAYNSNSKVVNNTKETGISFSPDLKREPTYFNGKLGKNIEFREAISALHSVVVSDMRYKPKDKTEYLEWLRKQESKLILEMTGLKSDILNKLEPLQQELDELMEKKHQRWETFYKKRKEYFNYLYKTDYDAWFVFDPVITVHPDEVFFECFSVDESTYGKLSVHYDVFKQIGEFQCGTTNIDYSYKLYNEFQKIRSYKETDFTIDPSGFEVATTNEDTYKEIKIDLPESWVRGFLQVNSASFMPMTSFTMHPMDIYNLCFILRRNKEIKGPRSLRFVLKPNASVTIVIEPWDYKLVCHRSFYQGTEDKEIRIWGRRRLNVLERLIPLAKDFTVHLMGTGMPSFYIADLGDMYFTLGLSGWSSNDWSSAGNFNLMVDNKEVDSFTKNKIFKALKENWYENPNKLSERLGLDNKIVLNALSSYAQEGKAIFDLNKKVYRVRELSREPLPMDKLRFSSEKEEKAFELIEKGAVNLENVNKNDIGNLILSGKVKEYQPNLTIDRDERIIDGKCNCNDYFKNKLYKGPCEHMLALRIKYNNLLEHTRR